MFLESQPLPDTAWQATPFDAKETNTMMFSGGRSTFQIVKDETLFFSGYKNQYQYCLNRADHKEIPAKIKTAARNNTNKHINTWGR